MKKFPPKLNSAVWLLGVDWTPPGLLPSGVTITSATASIVVHPDSTVIDPSPATMLSGPASVIGGLQVVQKVIGGVANCRYLLTFTPTLTDGQVDPEQVSLVVPALQP